MPAGSLRPITFARKFPFIVPRCYVLGKVLIDPLYPAVMEVLLPTREPLLDVGCGMGVLAYYLRENGWEPPCICMDLDPNKIVVAKRLQKRWPGSQEFHVGDAGQGLPDHLGSVTVLDMLQYLSHEGQKTLLTQAAERVSANGVLVIRNAMAGEGGRGNITRTMDRVARWWRWMSVLPRDYPDRHRVQEILASQGLQGEFQPLWGKTPFHNWLGVFRRSS